MTTEDRLTRIENALIRAGLMLPEPSGAMPSDDEIMRDVRRGDFTSLKKAAVVAFKTGRRLPLSRKGKQHERRKAAKG
jgi:hypothetical protein